MKKRLLTLTVLTASLMLAAPSFASGDKKDTMMKDDMKKSDTMMKDTMMKDDMKKPDTMMKDTMMKDDMKKPDTMMKKN
ncbi:hypothetical protein BMS3Bbin10_01462 [bacterium BMS3Bbin10]|nr:hypothetical protein BMS3Bbin10_01462 [bacterium BMS3Bbin10]